MSVSAHALIPAARRLIRAAAVAAGLAAAPLAAPADTIAYVADVESLEGLGEFTGSVAVDNVSDTQATIVVTLTNTSNPLNGGYVTGFAFNLPDGKTPQGAADPAAPDVTAVDPAQFAADYDPWRLENEFFLLGGGVDGPPFGKFDLGASIDPDKFSGSGQPHPGLAVGQTGTFTFGVTGINLNAMTASGLLTYLSEPKQDKKADDPFAKAVPFLVRFRGFDDDGSDKVVGGEERPTLPTPAPSGAVLALVGVGVGLVRRRRRSA